ncbi:uncharacterized protein LOC130686702 isoform X2 [Daphnia carinata]|uniref:uncharacterized protein LOC130686702 isoform X2 n=1 Tax=Daphnia carinata TaxID=120202 RepID=UPI00257ACA84|nr:uncharacterized protein LOC130686702 isoform X2 [Daphnia carinata]
MPLTQKTNAFVIAWMFFVLVQFLPNQALETCRRDAECTTPGTYCLGGFCDGHCIPCHQFLRNPPYSGDCAKREEDCGTCVPGTVAEELVGMRHAFRCKKAEDPIPYPKPAFTVPEWRTLTFSVVGLTVVLALVAVGTFLKHKGIVFRHRQTSGTSLTTPNNSTGVLDEAEQPLTSGVPPNEERRLERERNVKAQPIDDPVSTNSMENLELSAPPFPSDVPSIPDGSANNNVLAGGTYDGVTIELSGYRNGNQTESTAPSATLPISNAVPVAIEMEPDGSDNESGEDTKESCYEQFNFGFFFKAERVSTRTAGCANNN